MELRHLRYFIAVAEAGGLVAASRHLNTSQPSLSRQLRDLEAEVSAQLFVRLARGIELTAAGRAFLDQARLSLAHAQEAVVAARRAAKPAKELFSVGFLSGQEVDWFPRVTQILLSELPRIEISLTSLHSPDLADALQRGDVDLGFLRIEPRSDVEYKVIAKEPLRVILPREHRLVALYEIDPRELEGEVFIGYSNVPHVLRDIVYEYLARVGVEVTPSHFLDDFGTGVSLVASTGGVALLPSYVEPLLPWSVVSRPLAGQPPTVDLAMGYRKDNESETLRACLTVVDQLIAAGPAGQRRPLQAPCL